MSVQQQNKLLFLSVPESLRGTIKDAAQGDFCINPDIPIPIEIPEGDEKPNLEGLSWEMIVAGMLRAIALGSAPDAAQGGKREWLDYYRCFILAVRPAIMAEFTEAAILKAHNGDFDSALDILDTLRGLFPSSPAVLLNRALVMEERASRGRSGEAPAFEAAEAAYAEALDLKPPFPAAFFNAGFFYLNRKDFRRAKEYFSRYISISDDQAKTERAESILKDIQHNGLEDESLNDAYAFIQQGNEEAGMRSIRDYIEKYPSVWNGWFVLGWALRRLGRWQDGAAALGRAVELGGGSGAAGSDTRNELAICLMEAGDQKGARRELEAALCDDPENIKIISNLGVLALKTGNSDEAAAFFRTVLELDPEDPVARSYLHAL